MITLVGTGYTRTMLRALATAAAVDTSCTIDGYNTNAGTTTNWTWNFECPFRWWTCVEILRMVFGPFGVDLRHHYRPLRTWPKPRALRRYNQRSEPRWPRGRWKAKT